MTQEEKARAYDEALKDMRAIYPNLKGDAKLAVEHAFPELAESEDEKVIDELNLLKEIQNYYEKNLAGLYITFAMYKRIARYFYSLGKKQK